MSGKIVLLFCAQVLLIQTISAQYIGVYDPYGYGAPWGAAPLASPCGTPLATASLAAPCYGPAAFSASNGGGFSTASSSPLIPAGVSVISENAYEGTLAVGGALPFLGTVAIEGALPTAGAGAIAYGCGNGAVRITAENVGGVNFAGTAGPLGYGAGLAGPLGYGAGLAGPLGYGPDLAAIGYGPGYGCGSFY